MSVMNEETFTLEQEPGSHATDHLIQTGSVSSMGNWFTLLQRQGDRVTIGSGSRSLTKEAVTATSRCLAQRLV